jgi:hypothetical protein
MATWDITELQNETCLNCGKKYTVKYQSLPLRDDDKFTCSCGKVLRSWRETGMYMYTEIVNENQA